MTTGLVVPADPAFPIFEREFTRGRMLEELYEAIGCSRVQAPDCGGATFYCDEEAKMQEAWPMNQRLNAALGRCGWDLSFDQIVGTAVLFGPVDSDGYDSDVSNSLPLVDHLRRIEKVVRKIDPPFEIIGVIEVEL